MLRLRHATAVVLFTTLQCLVSGLMAGAANAQAQEAVWPTRTWPVSTPEEQGMQSGGLARLVETVGGYKQDSLLIARHGKIVLDAYYAPYQPNITHDLRSVTKSIVSTLTAIERWRSAWIVIIETPSFAASAAALFTVLGMS